MKPLFCVLITIALTSVVLPSMALAGQAITSNVKIYATGAAGSLKDARENGSQQYIGCTASYSTAGQFGYCSAYDESGKFLSCYTYNFNFIDIIKSSGDNAAYLHFVRGSNGQCKYILSSSDSSYL